MSTDSNYYGFIVFKKIKKHYSNTSNSINYLIVHFKIKMSLSCANSRCELPLLTAPDARIEIKAVLPEGWSSVDNACVAWKRNGEAAFHIGCWRSVLKTARSRRSSSAIRRKGSAAAGTVQPLPAPVMLQTEKMMVMQAAKTLEMFDSEGDVRKAAKEAAQLILKARHCLAFTGHYTICGHQGGHVVVAWWWWWWW